MTFLVCLDLIKRMDINPKETYVKISQKASSMKGTSANFMENEFCSIWDLLHGLMLPSGNDAAYSIAENFGEYLVQENNKRLYQYQTNKGNDSNKQNIPLKAFLDEMNKQSQTLKLDNTYFDSPHGLINYYNRSSAADIALLSCYAMKNNIVREIVNKETYTTLIQNDKGQSREIQWINTNKLLNKGYSGIKTGYTKTAGSCLASTYQISPQIRIIIVVLGADTAEDRFTETELLNQWAQSQINFIYRTLAYQNGYKDDSNEYSYYDQ